MFSMSMWVNDDIHVRLSHDSRKGTRVELRDAVNRKLYKGENDATMILGLVPEDCWPPFALDYLTGVVRQHELSKAQDTLFV